MNNENGDREKYKKSNEGISNIFIFRVKINKKTIFIHMIKHCKNNQQCGYCYLKW